jgi:glycosyltransferase involved in cell wall biosynthesis
MQRTPKALLILTPGFPENEQDSTCLPALSNFVQALANAAQSTRVVVITLQYPYARQHYRWHGIDVYACGGRNRPKAYRLLTWLHAWRRLLDLRASNQVVGIFSFWLGECALVGERFAKRYGIRHFCWLLGQDARPGNRFLTRAALASGSIVAISDSLADEFFKNYLQRPRHIIPLGIRKSEQVPVHTVRDIDVLGAGSLIPLKRFDLFIDLIAALRDLTPTLKVVISGKGPEADRLHSLIAERNLYDTVKLTGEIPHNALLALMQRSKVFLHTSSYEGLAAVLLEALLAGCQVISFCKPMNESVPHFHPVASVQEAIDSIKELLYTGDYTAVFPFDVKRTAQEALRLIEQQ